MEGILAVHRHDFTANIIGGAVEGNGEAELERFVREFADLRGETAGGDGNLAGADAPTPRGVENFEGLEEVIVISQRLAHAHDDEIIDQAVEWLVFTGIDRVPPFDGEDLLDDFMDAQIAFPTFEAAGAKTAAISAPNLGGDAEGVAITGLAVEGGIGRNKDAFNEGAVGEAPKEFLGGVA